LEDFFSEKMIPSIGVHPKKSRHFRVDPQRVKSIFPIFYKFASACVATTCGENQGKNEIWRFDV
jgi:hypothetical protein